MVRGPPLLYFCAVREHGGTYGGFNMGSYGQRLEVSSSATAQKSMGSHGTRMVSYGHKQVHMCREERSGECRRCSGYSVCTVCISARRRVYTESVAEQYIYVRWRIGKQRRDATVEN